MKINEKNLCSYAVSATPIDKEGYLNKKSDNRFQKRYFVLKGNLLFYFDKKGDKEPVGVIILEGCTIELSDEEDQFCFKIVFHGPGNRTYVLATDSQPSMEQWMKALACSSYDYVKLMVEELRRQLQELDDPLPTSQIVASPIPPPRQRYNPFNKTDSPHQRSLSLRSSVKKEDRSPESSSQSKASITFRELHNAYGRPILRDFNLWKNEKKQKASTVENLILF